MVNRAVGGSSDWTSFDVGKSDADVRRTLRKLHLRWWHATRTQMEKILHAAGVPERIIAMIPSIIDTCRECRVWMAPNHDPTPTVDLCCVRNEQVEADIMFYKKHMVWHMLDRADRWYQGVVIHGKDSESLQSAMDECWFRTLGVFKFLIIDGEKGIMAQDTQ